MQAKTINFQEFTDGAEAAVLAALDEYMRDLTGCDKARGATDADLPALFDGLHEHMKRVAQRLNNPESQEVGSAYLTIERAPTPRVGLVYRA